MRNARESTSECAFFAGEKKKGKAGEPVTAMAQMNQYASRTAGSEMRTKEGRC